jgi:hypothetical protein
MTDDNVTTDTIQERFTAAAEAHERSAQRLAVLLRAVVAETVLEYFPDADTLWVHNDSSEGRTVLRAQRVTASGQLVAGWPLGSWLNAAQYEEWDDLTDEIDTEYLDWLYQLGSESYEDDTPIDLRAAISAGESTGQNETEEA